ncbi:hypothetical protein AALO_G00272720 [Alosa alosa]|uniref:Uncharacterized protein n=1 Tax=Alosa alosa TaxID=278164 RepID=A0AAV6FR13_9TELE|nr:hypothetical protein AALO_G00272720 [Alosa alosa]
MQNALLLAVQKSTKHFIVSQSKRTEERHGLNLYLMAISMLQLARNRQQSFRDRLFLKLRSVQGRISRETHLKRQRSSNFARNTCRRGTCQYIINITYRRKTSYKMY